MTRYQQIYQRLSNRPHTVHSERINEDEHYEYAIMRPYSDRVIKYCAFKGCDKEINDKSWYCRHHKIIQDDINKSANHRKERAKFSTNAKKICHCGTEFTPSAPCHKTCSKACSYKQKKKLEKARYLQLKTAVWKT